MVGRYGNIGCVIGPPGAVASGQFEKHFYLDSQAKWQYQANFGVLLPPSLPPNMRRPLLAVSRDDGGILCGEIELHNRASLLQSLQLTSPQGQSLPDQHLVLLAFRQWGEDCLDRLIGHFTFIHWDAAHQTLFAAVDHLGIGRLYFKPAAGGSFCLSSSLARLCARGTATLDAEYGLAYLANRFPQAHRTPYDGVDCLAPGSCIRIENTKLLSRRYWRLSKTALQQSRCTGDEAATDLRERLFCAVRDRLVSDGKNGVLLSGGLDSSSIACIAHQLLRGGQGRLAAFARVMGRNLERDLDGEERYLDALCQAKNIPVYKTIELQQAALEDLHHYYADRATLPLNPFPFLSGAVLELAAEKGFANLLSGYGGDETASTFGLTSLALLLRKGEMRTLVDNMAKFRVVNHISLTRTIRGYIIAPLIPQSWKKLYRFLRRRPENKLLGNAFIRPEVLRDPSVGKSLAAGNGYLLWSQIDPRLELQQRVQSNYFRPMLDLYDFYDNSFGVRRQCPFLDRRIVEFMCRVYPGEYLSDGWSRSLLRRAMKGIVTEEVLRRKDKTPFNRDMPYYRCLQASDDIVSDVLGRTQSSVWDLVDYRALNDNYWTLKKTIQPGGEAAANSLALEMGRCINLAAFYQWHGK